MQQSRMKKKLYRLKKFLSLVRATLDYIFPVLFLAFTIQVEAAKGLKGTSSHKQTAKTHSQDTQIQQRPSVAQKSKNTEPENIITLEPITVFPTPEKLSFTVPSIEESREKVDRVSGGASLIEGERIKEGAAFTVTDALAYAPGVYVGDSQSGVAGGSRISIRGSDINTSFIPISGIKFLRNGMPFTNANGFTDTELLNLSSIQQIEVYRGANALEYGGSNLGGAINFITPTGYSADSVKVGMTLGTNGYLNPSVSAGGVLGKGWDAYGAFSYVDFNGNRDNSDQELFYGYGNIGYRWNESNETRLHIDLQDHNFHLSSSLTKQQLNENPHQTNMNRQDRPSGFPVYRVDLQHTIRLDDGDRVDVGAYFFSKDNKYNFQDVGFLYDLWQDAGLSWRHQINGELFGFENRLVWGGLVQWLWIKDQEYQPVAGIPGFLRFHEKDQWNNVEAYFQDQLKLTDDFTVVAGGQINYRSVEFERKFPALESGSSSPADQDFFNFNPKLGFIWQVGSDLQIFGNVSRSSEPPPLFDLKDIFQSPQLTSQTGTTIEIGTRGGNRQFKWDLAIYRAWLSHEFLTIRTPPTFVNFSTTNAQSTGHTGIELGFESTLPLNFITVDDQIRLRGSYTWSRFEFDNDPQLGDNPLPGIPEHNGRFEAVYQHPGGFYIGPNVTAVSSNWVDFTNTLAAQPYVLLGAKAGWDDGQHWKVYLDGRNLTNEYYAASVFVTGDTRVPDPFGRGAILFNPGPTRMVFAGFEYRY
jgi:iron complex outermembrane receptor protein